MSEDTKQDDEGTKDETPAKDEKPAEKAPEPKGDPEVAVSVGDDGALVLSGSGFEPGGTYEVQERSQTFIATYPVEADDDGSFSESRPGMTAGSGAFSVVVGETVGVEFHPLATAEWAGEVAGE